MEPLQITFLGTGCAAPTVERALSSIAIQYRGHNLLFDCPEGVQRQLLFAKLSYMRIPAIFISHFHADHVLGLPGLLATMSMHERDHPLTIFGPKGVKERVKKALELSVMRVAFEVKTQELKNGIVWKGDSYTVKAFPLKHSSPCFGFSFEEKGKEGEFQRNKATELGVPEGPLWAQLQQGKSVKAGSKTVKPEQVMDYSKARKGRKVSIVFDTWPNKSYYGAIRDSDWLAHEASFSAQLEDRAKETLHSTAKAAGTTARETNAKQLVLFHISNRYSDAGALELEAAQEFGNVVLAKDLMKFQL